MKVTFMVLEIKVKYKMIDICFDENVLFWYERFFKGNKCSISFEEAKKILCFLDLSYVKYYVCMNDCIFYWDKYVEFIICPVCGVIRYKKRKKVFRKVGWYFSIVFRLQRYFADFK